MNFRLPVFLIVAAVVAGCSATSPGDERRAKLEKLKKQQAELSREIKELEAQIDKDTPDSARVAKAKEVNVTEIKPRSFDHYVQTQGRIEAENNILISARTMGVVEKILVVEGQQVSKGQVLAQIDNSLIQTSIESMETQLELANTVFERQKNLWDQKIGTEVQYLQAKTNKESLEKQLAALKEQNEMTKIKAPVSGVIDHIHVKVGENISPGMPALRIVNNNDLKLVANVSEAYVAQVRRDNKVVVEISELNKVVTGKVSFVGRNIDPMSRTFAIEVAIPSEPDLRPNMTATVKVVFNTVDAALVVPVNTIQTLNNEKVIYVAEKDGNRYVAKRKTVKIDGVFNNQAQVQGLEPGDQVITFGYQGLNDGETIKI